MSMSYLILAYLTKKSVHLYIRRVHLLKMQVYNESYCVVAVQCIKLHKRGPAASVNVHIFNEMSLRRICIYEILVIVDCILKSYVLFLLWGKKRMIMVNLLFGSIIIKIKSFGAHLLNITMRPEHCIRKST